MTFPYDHRPDYAWWTSEVAGRSPADVQPHIRREPFIHAHTRIATAGSCFAQHISRRLQASGFTYLVPERAPPGVPPDTAKELNFGTFSCRYGNIYTARQLLQLMQRALGQFEPKERAWAHGDRFVDPFRPSITPNGYRTAEQVETDAACHLAAVRRMFTEAQVFVFTMGLTEAWVGSDGAVYPVCPGSKAGGVFDEKRHSFVNFSYPEIWADMLAFLKLLFGINRQVRVILTVSPVPLVVTMEDQSVLTSTTYSKSTLRAVAGDLERRFGRVRYFPSYEIITGSYARGQYFSSNLRDVKEEGVDHVMRVFFDTLTHKPKVERKIRQVTVEESDPDDLVCEEVLLEASRGISTRKLSRIPLSR